MLTTDTDIAAAAETAVLVIATHVDHGGVCWGCLMAPEGTNSVVVWFPCSTREWADRVTAALR
ncbi:hypothetical protein Cs7R123_42910 [Catellatospora sp. TT07R-123]|nr:hypothetical protein Cs7R123_42910 [Catellatospora sp. TT07R-123]